MNTRPTRRERCLMGKHTPITPERTLGEAVRHDVCRYCRRPIMRTGATRIWFLAGVMADPDQRLAG